MVFHCIVRKKERKSSEYLKEAAQSSGYFFNAIHPEDFSYLKPPEFNRGDILYRVSTGIDAQILEKWLYRDHLITFYDPAQKNIIMYNRHTPLIYEKEGIPMPRTIQHVTRNRKILRSYVAELGGFPVVVKAYPGSMGVGVMKADSYGALFSLVDYLAEKNEVFMLRKFIAIDGDAIYSNRAVVLGNDVAIAYRNESVEQDDFRSNCNQQARRRAVIDLPEDQMRILVRAVKVLGLEFGGVDFLIDKEQGGMYILETNFPFNFIPVIEDLLFPIHYKIVEYMKNKMLLQETVARRINLQSSNVP